MANFPLTDITVPIENVANADHLWCVYEHHLPPHIIYVNACKLIDVFRMRDARNNSEWAKMFAEGGGVHVVITMVTDDRNEAFNRAIERAKSITPMPRCNLHGYNMHRTARPLICSNGMTYPTQQAAAAALNISQSNISRHLNGGLAHVNGLTFAYGPPP